jgi:molybdenum cofactor cytidylyltransferase
MGRVKQLLPYAGGTLLTHTIAEAVSAGFHPIIVVLGANAEAIQPAIEPLKVEIVLNSDWESGMGSSIRAGVHLLLQRADVARFLAILLADQPHVTAAHLTEMHGLLSRSHAPVIAAEYAGTVGVPAIFCQDLYPELLALPNHAGARHLLRNAGAKALQYQLPAASVDIDTPADFAELTGE